MLNSDQIHISNSYTKFSSASELLSVCLPSAVFAITQQGLCKQTILADGGHLLHMVRKNCISLAEHIWTPPLSDQSGPIDRESPAFIIINKKFKCQKCFKWRRERSVKRRRERSVHWDIGTSNIGPLGNKHQYFVHEERF